MTILDFWLVTVVVIAGALLGYPLVRAVARAIEARLVGRPRDPDPLGERGMETPLIMQLERRIADLEREQERLQDQQSFLESLLEERREPPSLEPPE
jgi:predicted RNase H-like nuclease (RuvC/YqgF family)